MASEQPLLAAIEAEEEQQQHQHEPGHRHRSHRQGQSYDENYDPAMAEQKRIEHLAMTSPMQARRALLQHAAILLHEGKKYLKFRFHPMSKHHREAFFTLHFSKRNFVQKLEVVVSVVFLLLAIFEHPAAVPTPVYITCIVELFCCCFFIWDLMLRIPAAGGWSNWFSHTGHQVRLFAIFCVLLDIILASAGQNNIRPLRLLRPFFLIDAYRAAGVRRVLRQMISTFFKAFDMIVFLLFYILLWSVIGFYFFGPIGNHPKCSEHDCAHTIDPYFSSFDQSFVSLFVAITTANHPDVGMTAFHNNNAAPLFFVLYMAIGVFFVLNLFLAVVYQNFTDFELAKFKRILVHRRRALRRAFHLAVEADTLVSTEKSRLISTKPEITDVISFRTFRDLMRFYKTDIDDKSILIIFEYLYRSNVNANGASDKTISLNEFFKLYDALQHRWLLDIDATLLRDGSDGQSPKAHHPRDPFSFRQSFAFVESPYFVYFIQFIILANVAAVIIEASTYQYNAGSTRNMKPRPWEYMFFVIYCLEAIAKMIYYTTPGYFKSKWNTFDFGIIFLSFIGLMLQNFESGHQASTIGPIFRSIRLWRVLRVRKSFRHVLLTMSFLFRHMTRYVIVLFVINYFFALIGMMAFANTVSERCLENGYDCGSEYDTADNSGYYELQNFDNIFLSYNTLFTLMVVNNWQLVMEGHAIALKSQAARTYFLLYYLIAVIIVSNVIVAFLLDVYLKIHPMLAQRDTTADNTERETHGKESQSFLHRLFRRAKKNNSDPQTLQTAIENNIVSVGLQDNFVGVNTLLVDIPVDTIQEQNCQDGLLWFLVSVARVAHNQTAFNSPLSATAEISGMVMRLTSSAEPLSIFQERVWPILNKLYKRWNGNESRASEMDSLEEQEDLGVEKTHEETVDGDKQTVVRVPVLVENARKHFPASDADLQIIARMANPVYLLYVSRKEITRAEVNSAMWGNDIERWCVENDFLAEARMGKDPNYFLDLRTLAADDVLEEHAFN